MRRFVLLALLTAACSVLAEPQEASARGRRHCRGVYMPAYHGPPPVYFMPPYRPPLYMPPARPVVEVGAYDMEGFKPKEIRVAPGTTVRWVNHGKEGHTVTSRDGLFDSGPLAPGATYSVTFTRPGTFHYFCRPHEEMGMVGTVVVEAGGSGAAPGSGSGSSGY